MKIKKQVAVVLMMYLVVGMLSASPVFVFAMESSDGMTANGYEVAALSDNGAYENNFDGSGGNGSNDDIATPECDCAGEPGGHAEGCPQFFIQDCDCGADGGGHLEGCLLNVELSCDCEFPDGVHDRNCLFYEEPSWGYGFADSLDDESYPLYDGSFPARFSGARARPDLARSKNGEKNAYINGSKTAMNGAETDPVSVKPEDKIRYAISTHNYKQPDPSSGAKYDVLFLLDWSESMGGTMVPGQSARLYERDVMLDMCDFIFEKYPESRVAVMGMNSTGMNNKPTETYIQFQTDFLNAAQYDAKLPDIWAAFNVEPRNRTEDLVSFLKAANQKMEGQSVTYGSPAVGGAKNTIPRGGDDKDERIPVIMLISDFQIPWSQMGGDYWSYYMKGQSDRFASSFPNGILQTVRFDHYGNKIGGNAVYSSATYDGYMRKYVSPAGRAHWRFTKINENTSYTDVLAVIMSDFTAVVPPADVLGTIITDVVPEGLVVDQGSISHGGQYNSATRTITWDLSAKNQGAITVDFTATVKQEPQVFENKATITFPDGSRTQTNATYHKTGRDMNMNVTFTKTVKGDFGNTTRDFKFNIHLFSLDNTKPLESGKTFTVECGVIDGSGATAPSYTALTLDWEVKLVFNLKHGQAITIKDIPSHLWIMVTEEGDKNYETTFTDSKDGSTGGNSVFFQPLETADGIRIFDFVNERIYIPPTGIAGGSLAAETLLLIVASMLLAGFAVSKVLRRL